MTIEGYDDGLAPLPWRVDGNAQNGFRELDVGRSEAGRCPPLRVTSVTPRRFEVEFGPLHITGQIRDDGTVEGVRASTFEDGQDKWVEWFRQREEP